MAREKPSLEAKALTMLKGEPDACGRIVINSPHGCSDVLYAFACQCDEDGALLLDTLEDIRHLKTFGGGILYDCKGRKNVKTFAFFGKYAFEFAATSHNTRGIRRYIDTLNADATRAFLKKTFDGYKQLGPLKDYVEAIFTDEPQIPALCRVDYIPNYLSWARDHENDVFRLLDLPDSGVALTPYIPWTEKLPDTFLETHGYALAPKLVALFEDAGDEGRRVRADFWETVSLLFHQNFVLPYSNFCHENKISFTGHFLHEESLPLHPYMHGDILKMLGEMDMPGCDLLVAAPDNILQSATAVKLATSAATLYGKTEVMAEVSNMRKDAFPLTPEIYRCATAMEAAMGINRFASYYTDYSMEDRKIQACCDFAARLLSKLKESTPERRVFIYLPSRVLWEETYPARAHSEVKGYTDRTQEIADFLSNISEALIRSSIDFTFVNDEMLPAVCEAIAENAILVYPEGIALPSAAKKFPHSLGERKAENAADTLRAQGYAPLPLHSAKDRVLCTKRTAKGEEVLLLVSYADNEQSIVLPQCRLASVYDPYTDAEFETNKAEIILPCGECRIVTLHI